MKKAKAARPKSLACRMLESQTGLPWIEEHRFCDGRQWRFDYACLEAAIAIEVEGGIWTQGRHSRGAGMLRDMEKYNTAQLFGWIVLRYTPEQFNQLAWVDDVAVAKQRVT